MNLQQRYLEIRNEVQITYQEYLNQDKSLKKLPELIAVSKTFSTEMIKEVYELGQRYFAENYVNEFVDKYAELSGLPIKWHFIGHLQTNKVDKVVGNVEMIQSVDSERLLKKIIDMAEKKTVVQKILLQIKFGDEETKHGFDLEDLDSVIKKYKVSSAVKICGLMCILPLNCIDEDKRKYFLKLRQKLFSLQSEYALSDDFKELSMGMSDDFKLAILEGSTMIRIGSAIFGARI